MQRPYHFHFLDYIFDFHFLMNILNILQPSDCHQSPFTHSAGPATDALLLSLLLTLHENNLHVTQFLLLLSNENI